MIIGIDETGTFDLNSTGMSLFVGSHFLDLPDLHEMTKNLSYWKQKYKHLKNPKGEIKSSKIDETIADDFIENVIIPQKNFHFNVCAVVPSEHRKKDIQFHRDHHIQCLNDGIRECDNVGNHKLARQYTELRNWYKNLNYQLLLKTWILGEMLGCSFVEHVIQTILDKTDKTLGIIRLSVDRDFIKEPTHIIFWKDFLRNQFYNYTYRHPVPIISEWSTDHPFFMGKGRNAQMKTGAVIDSKHIFRDNCNFAESHCTPEIQVADIIAKVIANYYNHHTFVSAYGKLKPYMIPFRTQKITLLKMSTPEQSKPSSVPNPYKNLADAVEV